MHLRTNTIRRNGHTYQYAQFVESYRRPKDGMPAHRVVAHLGPRSELEIANLRAALAASRKGRSLVLPREVAEGLNAQPVLANLAYLDVAVTLAFWEEWGLGELLSEVLPPSEQEVAPSKVLAGLTVQRCVEPRSKLYAQSWFPCTALPELLGVSPGQFNNTRLHRVLEMLDQGTTELQGRLASRIVARKGAFTALFLDVTDTWFEGRGPEQAEFGKVKEGMYRRKIGIVLMCNEEGLPLRWEVVQGRQHDSQAMLGLLESARDLEWLGQAPVVCDRAMGTTAHVKRLIQTGLRFLTALTENEIEAYTDRVPHGALSGVDPFAEDGARQAAEAVRKHGMSEAGEKLYVLDLQELERREEPEAPSWPAGVEQGEPAPVQRALEQAWQMREALEEGRAADFRDAGRPYGLKKERVAKLMRLLRLAPDLQEEVRDGRAASLSINAALRLASLTDRQAQREEFDRELATALKDSAGSRRRCPSKPTRFSSEADETRVRVRGVVCFNPEQFVEQRRGADETLAQIRAFVQELNRQLASPQGRRLKEDAYAEVREELRRHDLLDAFELTVHERQQETDARLRVELRLRPEVWQHRRRFDGFMLLVADPETLLSAAELARLYRAKNRVEQDFHIIKSVVKLRPVRHRLDSKVRAHVTLCMLALLLERSLESRLADTPCAMTAAMAFERLKTVHLNQLASADPPAYTVTRPSQDQLAILRSLGLECLTDDQEVAVRLTPR
jgi:hypothetical protein